MQARKSGPLHTRLPRRPASGPASFWPGHGEYRSRRRTSTPLTRAQTSTALPRKRVGFVHVHKRSRIEAMWSTPRNRCEVPCSNSRRLPTKCLCRGAHCGDTRPQAHWPAAPLDHASTHLAERRSATWSKRSTRSGPHFTLSSTYQSSVTFRH